MSAIHWFSPRRHHDGPAVYGVSSWRTDIPGSRLVNEHKRSTRLHTTAEIRRWAKRYPDVKAGEVEAAIKHLTQT